MKYIKCFWTIGCWISLFLIAVYHCIICGHKPVFPVFFSAFIVWFVGFIALSSMVENREFQVK